MLSTTVGVGDDGGVLARPEVSTSGLLRRRRSVDRRQDPSVGLDVDHRRVASTADVLKMPQKPVNVRKNGTTGGGCSIGL